MHNNIRDRLVELLFPAIEDLYENKIGISELADHLIANGVILPPLKVGDTFYGVNENSYDAYCVYGFKWGKRRGDNENILIILTTYDMEFIFGEEAFLTKEQAEQKLKEMLGDSNV